MIGAARFAPSGLRVSVVGHAGWAHHFSVPQIPQEPTKVGATAHSAQMGGMAANQAVAAARLGAAVRLFSRVGADQAGEAVLSQLAAEGVDCSGVLRCADRSTSVSAVVVDTSGERLIVSHRGSAIALDPPPLESDLLAGCQLVLVDPRWSAGAAVALTWARSNQVCAVLDADVCPAPSLAQLVALAPWAVFSLHGLAGFCGRALDPLDDGGLGQALAQALACGAQNAVVTLGAAGAAWWHGQQLHRVPSPAVAVVDTTGAGDVFHACFGLALAQGLLPPEAMRLACAGAALKCAGNHGILSAPSLAQLQAFLSS